MILYDNYMSDTRVWGDVLVTNYMQTTLDLDQTTEINTGITKRYRSFKITSEVTTPKHRS